MVIMRPVATSDLNDLLSLASMTGFGLTTLPHDPQWLARRIRDSQRGFQQVEGDPPRGESFLFVMEDQETGRVVGTCGIVSKVGGFEPFYAYRIDATTFQSEMLKVKKEIRTLHLVTEHNGPCEVGSLFLSPSHRKAGNGRLLSLCRFLFIAEHPGYFDTTVIAEMRGVLDENGRSAFWEAVGRHFFDIDYPKADYLSILNKKFIADLMPRYPIYISLLPAEAQAVIGQVHEQTKPALHMLEQQGFAFAGMVDIFEAGPVVSCPRDEIRPVRESVRATVADISESAVDAPECAVARCEGEFRAAAGPVQMLHEGGVRIGAEMARGLGVKRGDGVRYVALRSAKPG
jgi:arginine N-succinyltransferase